MKLIPTTAMLALAVVASPGAAWASQPGNSNSPAASDDKSASMMRVNDYVWVQQGKLGTPTSAMIRKPRNKTPMAMAMMSCCPKGDDAPVQSRS